MYKMSPFFFLSVLCCAFCVSVPDGVSAQDVTAIRTRAVVDVLDKTIVENAVVVVTDNKITAVGANATIPRGATIIDLSDQYLMPGMIDAHTHVTVTPDFASNNPILNKSIPYRTIEAVAAARATLMAGFTTIRDVDSEGADWSDVALRDAINDGLVVGPRMQVGTLAISITGGYMNNDGFAPHIDVPHYGALADSPDAIVKTLRLQVRNGTDWIKLYATGTSRHVNLENMEPLPQFNDDDIQLVVDEAARFGKPVAAHAYGGPAAYAAVEAGVRSIEHGMMLSDETLDLMVDKGTFWVPTITVYFPHEPSAELTERQAAITASHRRVFGRAVEKGVRIAYGTDAGWVPHGDNAIDFAKMVEYGMAPDDAVRAATIVGAELMELDSEVGSVTAGKLADLIAVRSNPLRNIAALSDVTFVMKDGFVYKTSE
jgi:imidazolonepropionase-like amidohydrolase